MKLALFFLLALLEPPLDLNGGASESAPFVYTVRHDHRFGHCDGSLRLDQKGIAYESPDREHTRVWSFVDIRRLDILSPTRLVIHTYGKPDTFDFSLREGELADGAYRLLAEHLERELTSRVLFTATEWRFELPVKHRHVAGGCNGVLRIGASEIVYDTEHREDKRMWRIRDVRSFGTTGPYGLRLTAETETFTFDVKQPLSQEVYDFLWQKIYGPQFVPVRNRL